MHLAPQLVLGLASAIPLAAYCFAAWCEAANGADSIDFNELLTWSRMQSALEATEWRHVVGVSFGALDYVALGGTLGGLFAACLGFSRFSAAVVICYALSLFLLGAWKGLVVICVLPWVPLDGEFLSDGMARPAASALWLMLIVGLASSNKWLSDPRPLSH